MEVMHTRCAGLDISKKDAKVCARVAGVGRRKAGVDMADATFACPDLTTFCRLDELGLKVVGQRLEPECVVLACRVLEPIGGAVAADAKAPPVTR